MQSPEREVDRLRAELESSQRQLAYQTSKVERLEMLLKEAQQCTNKHAEQLQKRVEQAEQELVRSNVSFVKFGCYTVFGYDFGDQN